MNKLTIEPEISIITQEVDISLGFTVKRTLSQVKWRVTYIIDSTGKRAQVQLFETPTGTDYQAGEQHTFSVKTPKLEVENVPRKRLLNVGLLRIEAYSGADNETLLNLNMVVHVSKDKADESILLKTVLNPLE